MLVIVQGFPEALVVLFVLRPIEFLAGAFAIQVEKPQVVVVPIECVLNGCVQVTGPVLGQQFQRKRVFLAFDLECLNSFAHVQRNLSAAHAQSAARQIAVRQELALTKEPSAEPILYVVAIAVVVVVAIVVALIVAECTVWPLFLSDR